MATHSSILTWEIPWTEGSGRLRFMGSQESETTQQLNHHHCVQLNTMVTGGIERGKVGRGINLEIGINKCTLLNIKQITNKDMLYSTGNSPQYSVMTYMEKESSKNKSDRQLCRYMNIYKADSLCCTLKSNTTM